LQDFGDCTQSSQIGPHLVQPLRARPMATTLKINAKRLNMADPLPASLIIRPQVGHFQAGKSERPFPPIALLNARWNVCAYSIRRKVGTGFPSRQTLGVCAEIMLK
jgi:hypothetical protein